MKTFRVVSRGSRLALAQTGQVVERLRRAAPDTSFEIVTVTTTGDRVTDRPLSLFRGTGVFVKELQRALLEGRADIAVHSLKDVPSDEPAGLALAAYARRSSPWDLLLARDGGTLRALPAGSLVGTGSPRRVAQLKAARPDLRFEHLRGNLDTRLRKLEEGGYDAIVVAAAGMDRLGKAYEPDSVLPRDICIPAVGQGVLVLECRTHDEPARAVVSRINDRATESAAVAERAFLAALGGGCAMPLAAYAECRGAKLTLAAMVGDPRSGRIVRGEAAGACDEARGVAEGLAGEMGKRCDAEGIDIS